MSLLRLTFGLFSLGVAGLGAAAPADPEAKGIDLGSRRELLVDEFLIESKTDLELQLHSPVAKEVVMTRDAPWEGSGSTFETIFRDGEIVRLYYMGMELTNIDGSKLRDNPGYSVPRNAVVCYAESKDGVHWTRPELGLFEFNGSKENNIIWDAPHLDNFVPFKDANPDCPPDELYKAVSSGRSEAGERGLYALKSSDGIHWSYLQPDPIITRGMFDTQNNAFWDPLRKQYWCYIRDFHGADGQPTDDTKTGVRDILVSTSKDFRHWTEPRRLDYAIRRMRRSMSMESGPTIVLRIYFSAFRCATLTGLTPRRPCGAFPTRSTVERGWHSVPVMARW